MSKPLAIVSVINDLVTDRRVHKSCVVLYEQGYDVLLVGRVLKNSLPLDDRPYKTYRMNLWFTRGVAFYAEFTIRLWFFIRKNKAQLLVANDLDTLWPNNYFSDKRNISLIYDSHEIFCEVPELQHAPVKKRIWEGLEKRIVPKLKCCITVNRSIADWFKEKYKVDFKVVRNIPDKVSVGKIKSRQELNLPIDKKIILLQGAGINIQRGVEEAIDAMRWVENIILLIIGSGDALERLKIRSQKPDVKDKIIFLPKMKPEELCHYTSNADIGLSLDKDTNINYRFSLPNKIFDYVAAGVPVLASPLTEIKSFIDKYKVGLCIDNHEPEHIAAKMNEMLSSPDYQTWKANTKKACEENSWENEKKVWIDLLQQIKVQ
ncbi:MAG TPA: glycosyltransferase [Bacteroidia bacterium]|jgi:glycosyltransferase involved in cell wall biosynthesis|nr:glycosyltransferase [Bacteroidia bacterium]